jgi:hypothetical protein
MMETDSLSILNIYIRNQLGLAGIRDISHASLSRINIPTKLSSCVITTTSSPLAYQKKNRILIGPELIPFKAVFYHSRSSQRLSRSVTRHKAITFDPRMVIRYPNQPTLAIVLGL